MRLKKILKTTTAIIILTIAIGFLVAVVGYLISIGVIFSSGFLGGSVETYKEAKKSSLGDEFVFVYEESDFPERETTVEILDSKGKDSITSYTINYQPYRAGELVTIIDEPNVRCYQIEQHLIYRIGSGSFKGLDISFISVSYPEMNPTFVEVAKSLVATKQWNWIKACGNFLLEAGDEATKQLLERYAKGQFTEEEIELNKDGSLTEEEMQSFAEQVLQNSETE